MRTSVFFLLLLAMSLSQCASPQPGFVSSNEAPFTVDEAVAETWGYEENKPAKGEEVFLKMTLKNDIVPDSLHYKGKQLPLTRIEKGGYVVYIASLLLEISKPDIIMHANPRMEGGNRPPIPQRESPFELKEQEAVLSYEEKGKRKYVKIDQVVPSSYMRIDRKP